MAGQRITAADPNRLLFLVDQLPPDFVAGLESALLQWDTSGTLGQGGKVFKHAHIARLHATKDRPASSGYLVELVFGAPTGKAAVPTSASSLVTLLAPLLALPVWVDAPAELAKVSRRTRTIIAPPRKRKG